MGNLEKRGIKVEIPISTSGIETREAYADWLFRQCSEIAGTGFRSGDSGHHMVLAAFYRGIQSSFRGVKAVGTE
jgi:hypothetical protein